ncbi:MAG TPA: hemolysin family protein [Acidimicrobiales bacterium]|nr:hemolysin family protein [Acidimicrobiales bacterium]
MITTVVLPIIAVLVLVLVNGLFVAAEFALVGARRSRVQAMADSGSTAARWLLGVFDRPTGKDGYIAIAQLGITLASIGLGMYGEPAVAGWLYKPLEDGLGLSYGASHAVGFAIALSAITFLHVVFGEMIPKALALQAPESVVLRVNPAMRAFGLVFRPMVAVLNAAALGLMRLLRIPEPDKSTALYTSAELEIVTDEAASSGQLGALQRDLIRNIFELDERRAEELMTSRGRLEVLDLAASADEVAAQVTASPRSRYPVIDGDLDHVVGVLHIKDFIRASRRSTVVLADLIRPLPTVAATASAEQLLERFTRTRTHACLVVDEVGGTLGVVTLDDVIAEVMEEGDESGSSAAVHHDDGSISLDGEVTLAELRDDHGLTFTHDEVATLAGLVLAAHGTVPDVGTAVDVQGHELVVEDVLGHKITRVRVRRLER